MSLPGMWRSFVCHLAGVWKLAAHCELSHLELFLHQRGGCSVTHLKQGSSYRHVVCAAFDSDRLSLDSLALKLSQFPILPIMVVNKRKKNTYFYTLGLLPGGTVVQPVSLVRKYNICLPSRSLSWGWLWCEFDITAWLCEGGAFFIKKAGPLVGPSS